MSKNVKILDCTLRDGGRIIDCAFPQFHIDGIARGLVEARVDMIELGFLRSGAEYNGDSTFFTDMEQARKCVPTNKGDSMFVLFADYGEEYGMWDFSKLPDCDGETITGIRLGFRKEDFIAMQSTANLIKDKGYKLVLQMIETRNYSDVELVTALSEINTFEPYAVGLVDTFGAMYKDDLMRIYTLADHNLDDEITIDFHSHNNMQLSFSFSQEIVEMSHGKRKIILDATLNGLGKGSGNLNTELIIEYLNSKLGYDYDLDRIFDMIDDHIMWIKREHEWGYSIPTLMSGLFSSHPNNVSYLLQKNRLQTKDLRHILSRIEPNTRKRYDYANIDRLYLEYSSSQVEDSETIELLRSSFSNRVVLVVVFGASSRKNRADILKYIADINPIVISVNHIYYESSPDFCFYGNARRYNNDESIADKPQRIITSNIIPSDKNDIVVNYNKYIAIGFENYDNSTIMLLNLLKSIGVKTISIAGLDGYSADTNSDYSDQILSHNNNESEAEKQNDALKFLLRNFADSLADKCTVNFITNSRFSSLFE